MLKTEWYSDILMSYIFLWKNIAAFFENVFSVKRSDVIGNIFESLLGEKSYIGPPSPMLYCIR